MGWTAFLFASTLSAVGWTALFGMVFGRGLDSPPLCKHAVLFLMSNAFPVGQPSSKQVAGLGSPFFSSYLQWAGQPFLVALGWTALPCLVWLDSHSKYMLSCNFVGPKQVLPQAAMDAKGKGAAAPKGAAKREGARWPWERSCNL